MYQEMHVSKCNEYFLFIKPTFTYNHSNCAVFSIIANNVRIVYKFEKKSNIFHNNIYFKPIIYLIFQLSNVHRGKKLSAKQNAYSEEKLHASKFH